MPSFIATSDGSPSSYAELEPGIYNAIVTKAEPRRSSQGNDMIRLYLRVFGTHGAAEVQENLVFTASAFWKIEQFWRATGHNINPGDALSLDARDCFNLSCWVETDKKPGKKDGVFFPYVARFMREEDAPYKGIAPVYVPQNRQQPAAQQQQQQAPQQQGGWSRQGNNLYPPSGANRPAAQQQAPTLEDDDIPF